MFGKVQVPIPFCLLLTALFLLLYAPVADAAQPGFWYDGHRKVPLHAGQDNRRVAPLQERSDKNAPGNSSRKNNGTFYVCYPPDWSIGQILNLEADYDLTRVPRHITVPSVRIYRHADAEQALMLANRIYEENDIPCAAPLWQKQVATKNLATTNDPLFSQQWYLDNTGQCDGTLGHDISAPDAWIVSLGAGITIAIVDDGVELDHPDLVDNLLSAGHFDFIESAGNPNEGIHGTAVAGIAAGRGFNGIGLAGVAPAASLLSLRILPETGDLVDEGDEAAALYYGGATVDIYNNSWGPPDGSFAAFEGPSALARSAIEAGASKGRNGLGSIYVWAAGNGGRGDDSNLDGYANSRYALAVTATACSGAAASYAEAGSNILVNAPSNDGWNGMVSTDLLGFSGYNSGLDPEDLSDSDYTNTFGGTSGATSVVSGVVALMLAANDHLNWREVQEILAFSANKNDSSDELWRTNGAGFWINENYGYGRVNAEQAVRMATAWGESISEERSVTYMSSVNRLIPDADAHGLTEIMAIKESLRVENVMVTVDIPSHSYWGDLSMYLTSPQGTRVRLVRENFISSSALSLGYNQWTFKDTLHLGEHSAGDWMIEIVDNFDGDVGTLRTWSIQIFGTSIPDSFEQAPITCTAQSAYHPSSAIKGALVMGANLYGAAYGRKVTGNDNVDYGVVAAVRKDISVAEQLAVARYDDPNGSTYWYTLTNSGWQPWDEQIPSLNGFSNAPGQIKIVHAGKLSQGKYRIWSGFRDTKDEVFYCLEPLLINVGE